MKTYPHIELGNFITKKRFDLGYAKCEFANLLNVGDDTLRYWERGRFKPAGINKRNLIAILELTPNEILQYFNY